MSQTVRRVPALLKQSCRGAAATKSPPGVKRVRTQQIGGLVDIAGGSLRLVRPSSLLGSPPASERHPDDLRLPTQGLHRVLSLGSRLQRLAEDLVGGKVQDVVAAVYERRAEGETSLKVANIYNTAVAQAREGIPFA